MELFPAVDVLGGQVVRLHQGDYDRVTVYSQDPVGMAVQWMNQGARMVHVVDLDGARDGRPSPELWAGLSAAGVRFQVGGGLRNAEAVEQAIAAGADRVILGTAALEQVDLLGQLVSLHGKARVAVSWDIRGDRAEGAGWTDGGRDWRAALGDLVAVGVEWIMTTSITRDGTMSGPDIDLVRQVMAAAPDCRVVAAGGIGSPAHIEALAAAGATGAVVGRALYEGTVSLPGPGSE